MDVEQPREQLSTGGASSSSALAQPGQEAVPLSSPSTHEVRMETAGPFSSTRPLEGGDESSSKRVRSLAGMLLFDDNDTSDWQHSVHETRPSELSGDQHDQHDSTDHMQQPDTDIPGVWRWQVEWVFCSQKHRLQNDLLELRVSQNQQAPHTLCDTPRTRSKRKITRENHHGVSHHECTALKCESHHTTRRSSHSSKHRSSERFFAEGAGSDPVCGGPKSSNLSNMVFSVTVRLQKLRRRRTQRNPNSKD